MWYVWFKLCRVILWKKNFFCFHGKFIFFFAFSASQNIFMFKSNTDEQKNQHMKEEKSQKKNDVENYLKHAALFCDKCPSSKWKEKTHNSKRSLRCGKNDAGKLRFKRTNQVPKYYLSKFQIRASKSRQMHTCKVMQTPRTKCATTILFIKLDHSLNIFPIFLTFNLPHWHWMYQFPYHFFPDLF